MQTVAGQVLAIGALLLMGAIIGFLFDVYRVARGVSHPGGVSTALGDMLFWLVSSGMTFWFLLLINRGEVRLYIFLALLVGVLLYRFTLGGPLMQGLILTARGVQDLVMSLGSLPEVAFRARRWLSSRWRGIFRIFRWRRR